MSTEYSKSLFCQRKGETVIKTEKSHRFDHSYVAWWGFSPTDRMTKTGLKQQHRQQTLVRLNVMMGLD